MKNKPVLVTKTFLPPLSEYVSYLEKIWESHWLTNNGQFARELEEKMKKLLGVKHAFFVSNGTIALQIALKALGITGEVITTPFTFAATTDSILWENCKPVYVDIDPNTFAIDANKIEQAITKHTTAILAVHVYGYPCNVKKIESIAKKHNLKVIYDAAHAFNVSIGEKSIFTYGDVSTLSFHATKLFHTGEGGLVVTNSDVTAARITALRNFGFEGEDIAGVGVNAKNSELHAAMGLTNLNHMEDITNKRQRIYNLYKILLKPVSLHEVLYFKDITYNFSYFPVVFETEEHLLAALKMLKKENIFPRRYFYPSLNTLPFINGASCPISESVSKRVLCLPLYPDLPIHTVKKIAHILIQTIYKENALPTLSVGIPAHNESANIQKLIHSIFRQTRNNYTLDKIYIACDGCTDNTVLLVKKLRKKYPNIVLSNDGARKGKVSRLNEIYKKNTSDLLLTLDGDILLKEKNMIDTLCAGITKGTKVVAANIVPLKPTTLKAKLAYQNHTLWNNIRHELKDTNHIANLYGSATLLEKRFSKSVKYPKTITADEEYLFVTAYKQRAFAYCREAKVYTKPAESLHEFVKQGQRYKNERTYLLPYFGEEVLTMHYIPLSARVIGTTKTFVRSPFLTGISILYNLYLRTLSSVDELNKVGMWEIASTTKKV